MNPEPSLCTGCKTARCAARTIFVLGWFWKKRSSSVGLFVPVVFLGHFNDDHARRDDLEDFGESAVELMNDILARPPRPQREQSVWRDLGCCAAGSAAGRCDEAHDRNEEQQNIDASVGFWTGAGELFNCRHAVAD